MYVFQSAGDSSCFFFELSAHHNFKGFAFLKVNFEHSPLDFESKLCIIFSNMSVRV